MRFSLSCGPSFDFSTTNRRSSWATHVSPAVLCSLGQPQGISPWDECSVPVTMDRWIDRVFPVTSTGSFLASRKQSGELCAADGEPESPQRRASFIRHPRRFSVDSHSLVLLTIYKWFEPGRRIDERTAAELTGCMPLLLPLLPASWNNSLPHDKNRSPSELERWHCSSAPLLPLTG